jgi:uncharacterized repeat protein (TIGR03803 family)
MTSPPRHWNWSPGMHLRAARTVMALAGMLGPAIVAIHSAQAQSFGVLYAFTAQPDGGSPIAGLIRDAAGNLYGTTNGGGALGYGTVYRVDAAGTETVLYSFAGPPTDGAYPSAALVMDAAGNLYSTTSLGGAAGYGTVFKLDASGTETVLHSFARPPRDGAYPGAALVMDAAGSFYSTTTRGGASNAGTVFKLDTAGRETVLHSFTGGKDGALPVAGLVGDAAGNLFGTTTLGGASNSGTVFKLDRTGKKTVLYSFAGGSDGAWPIAGLVRDSGGNFYGTTEAGGATGNGTVFKLDASGNETILYSFGGAPDGATPMAGLIRDVGGTLYGTTLRGGSSFVCNVSGGTCGTVFRLSAAGKETVLHSFTGSSGGNPEGVLVRDAKGNLYGTAVSGGPGDGVVFKLNP